MSTLPAAAELVTRLAALGVTLPPGPVRVDGFGDSAALSAELQDLIRAGPKHAGTSLLWALEAEGETLPRVGDIEIELLHVLPSATARSAT